MGFTWNLHNYFLSMISTCYFLILDMYSIMWVWCLNTSQWRHNGRDGVSNHQPHECLLNRLFRCKSKKTSMLRVTGLCVGNSLVIGEFPAQMASNAENIFIWWRHHERRQAASSVSHLWFGLRHLKRLTRSCKILPSLKLKQSTRHQFVFLNN